MASSIPQFNLNDSLLNNISSQRNKFARITSRNNNQSKLVYLLAFFSIVCITFLFLFQIQIYALRTTISSLSQNNPPFQSLVSSNQDQFNENSNSINANFNLLDLKASSIITTEKQIKFIRKLFGSFQDSFKLLYKATYFGDSFESLYNVLDQEVSILLIIKTENGEIIGGYSPNTIQKKDSSLRLDSHSGSFTFEVNTEKKHPVYFTWDYFSKGILSMNYDLSLDDNFMSSDDNYYDFSQKDSNYQFNKLDPKHHKFRVVEMEIYKINRIK